MGGIGFKVEEAPGPDLLTDARKRVMFECQTQIQDSLLLVVRERRLVAGGHCRSANGSEIGGRSGIFSWVQKCNAAVLGATAG